MVYRPSQPELSIPPQTVCSVHLSFTYLLLPEPDPIEEVKKSDSAEVKVAVVDIDGILRGKYMQKEKFLSAAKGGFGFCSVVFGWDAGGMCLSRYHLALYSLVL